MDVDITKLTLFARLENNIISNLSVGGPYPEMSVDPTALDKVIYIHPYDIKKGKDLSIKGVILLMGIKNIT